MALTATRITKIRRSVSPLLNDVTLPTTEIQAVYQGFLDELGKMEAQLTDAERRGLEAQTIIRLLQEVAIPTESRSVGTQIKFDIPDRTTKIAYYQAIVATNLPDSDTLGTNDVFIVALPERPS